MPWEWWAGIAMAVVGFALMIYAAIYNKGA